MRGGNANPKGERFYRAGATIRDFALGRFGMAANGRLGVCLGLRRLAAAWWAACLLWPSLGLASVAVVTIVDGNARVVDGARAFAPAVGMRLAPGTLIDTAADAALLRVEWDDGRVLDLGPATRAMVSPPAMAARRAPMLYLLTGWVKQSTGVIIDAQRLPGLEVASVSGIVVTHVGAERSVVFVESGQVEVIAPANRETVALRQGDSVSTNSGERLAASARAPAGFAAQMPRGFRDTIARRLPQLGKRGVDAKALSAPSYGDLAPWLTAEPAIRRDFPRRFASLASDPTFRAALQSHLSAHPEWEVVLAPPRRPVTAAAAASR